MPDPDSLSRARQLLASGQLDRGTELLLRCLQLAPQHSHACTALGIAYLKKGDLPQAKKFTMQALAVDPRNPVALKNLGAILGQEGDSLRALYYLRQSYQADPKDTQTVYGLAFAYMELGDIEQAQKHFKAVMEMPGPEQLRALAKNGLREIAVRGLKSCGLRMDAVFYLLDAMRLFRGRPLEEVREIAFEIGMLGQHGLDINDPKETHVLRALPGRAFSALELLCIMYAGFKQIETGMDIGVDPLARCGGWRRGWQMMRIEDDDYALFLKTEKGRHAGSASLSLLSDLPARLKSPFIKLIRSFAACRMFFNVSKGDEFT